MSLKPKLYIICGPTAGSKSAFAMDLAAKLGGAIINADSMQIYSEIPIITASPSAQDKIEVSHYLYNHISVREEYSVGKYLGDALRAIEKVTIKGLIPIIVGGTGLYISALINGLSNIPNINSDLREQVRNEFEQLGRESFYARLVECDLNSSIIKAGDSQRMMRAYEVLLQTGNPISYYQNSKDNSPIEKYDVSVIMINPERNFLYKCCDERFEHLVKNGGLDEVRRLKEMGGKSKALGVAELFSFLDEEISLEKAIDLAQIKTRQYAKRQITWFNNQIKDKIIINSVNKEINLS